jgi:methylthioribose-1-phosphate isomerase
MILQTIDYVEGSVVMIDQAALPMEERMLRLSRADEVAAAIRSMRVRGAPAIGIAAAFGMLLELENLLRESDPGTAGFFFDRKTRMSGARGVAIDPGAAALKLNQAADLLAATRPTAVNLFRAVERMRGVARENPRDSARLCSESGAEAFRIYEEELETEKRIGSFGAALLQSGMSVLTHCNAGGLATAGYGTALAVIYSARELGMDIRVYADETRPLLQGGRLTAWELLKNGVDVTVLCDGAAASLISTGKIGAAIVGADRIAANGDTANKIGTLGVAVLCARFGVPFYVAAPLSTFDPDATCGESIPIEHRADEELIYFNGIRTIPEGARIYNPAFDVTPAELVTAFITEKGVIYPPYDGKTGRLPGEGS